MSKDVSRWEELNGMSAPDVAQGIVGIALLMVLAGIAGALYFAPTLVAFWRKATVRGTVAVLNAFLGWTLLGWIVALALACGPVDGAAKSYEK